MMSAPGMKRRRAALSSIGIDVLSRPPRPASAPLLPPRVAPDRHMLAWHDDDAETREASQVGIVRPFAAPQQFRPLSGVDLPRRPRVLHACS
jgi:hypothetical protein